MSTGKSPDSSSIAATDPAAARADFTALIHRYLDPATALAEILFGLIMTLTFTLSAGLLIEDEGRAGARELLIAVIGCNIAWGIIDGVLYLMAALAEQGRGLMTLKAVRRVTQPEKAHRLIADALPKLVASILQPA
jgi:hypothetical protein